MADRLPLSMRTLARPTYVIAGLLVVLPMLDLVVNVWPIRPGDVQWRYGTLGLLSGFLLTPLLGIVLAYAAAVVLEHRAVIRALAVLSLAVAVGLVVGALLFVLDALQFRSQAPPEALATFDRGMIKAFVKHLVVAGSVGWLGLVGMRGSSTGPKRRPTPVIRATGS